MAETNPDDVVVTVLGPDNTPLQTTRAAVVGGSVTTARPEIGEIHVPVPGGYGSCTATLVAPNLLVSAAHCVDYTSSSTGGGATFIVHEADGTDSTFPIDRYRSFSPGTGIGRGDVSILRLARAVPASVATPASLGSTEPARGTRLTIWGYGCTTRGYSSDGQKRRYDFNAGSTTHALCPGDSGGPVADAAGVVYYINSGYYGIGASGVDDFGNVPFNYASIDAQARAWGITLSTDPTDPVDPDPVDPVDPDPVDPVDPDPVDPVDPDPVDPEPNNQWCGGLATCPFDRNLCHCPSWGGCVADEWSDYCPD